MKGDTMLYKIEEIPNDVPFEDLTHGQQVAVSEYAQEVFRATRSEDRAPAPEVLDRETRRHAYALSIASLDNDYFADAMQQWDDAEELKGE